MPLQISPVDVNYTVDPTTGDITFHNTDGSTSVLKFDQDAGAYNTTNSSGTSNADPFVQSMLHTGLGAVAGNDKAIDTALVAISQYSGDDARYSYLQGFSQQMQNYSNSLQSSGNTAQAAGEMFQNLSNGLQNNTSGLAEHLDATGQGMIDKAQTSFQQAANASQVAAQSGSQADIIAARYANAGALVDAAQLLHALSGGDTGDIAKAAFGAAAGLAAGLALGLASAPLAVGLLAGLAVSFAADEFYDAFLSDYFKDRGNFWDNLFDSLGLSPLDREAEEAARRLNNDGSYRIVRYDPLALDLDGDGVVSTRAEGDWKGALFDHDSDGIRTATGWIGGQDGLLCGTSTATGGSTRVASFSATRHRWRAADLPGRALRHWLTWTAMPTVSSTLPMRHSHRCASGATPTATESPMRASCCLCRNWASSKWRRSSK